MVLLPILLTLLLAGMFGGNMILRALLPLENNATDKQSPFTIDSPDDLDEFYGRSEELTAEAVAIKDIVLVTGGSGFIGSHFVDQLIEEGYQVVVFDRGDYNPEYREQWKIRKGHGHVPAFLHIKGDISKREDLNLIPDIPIHYVVHCAGEPPAWRYEADETDGEEGRFPGELKEDDLDSVHIQGTRNLWDWMESRDHQIPRMIALSTTDIYGPLAKNFLPFKKRQPNPPNDWAKSKVKMEKFLNTQWRRKPKNVRSLAILRLTTVYGPRQDKHEGLVSHLIQKAISNSPLLLPTAHGQYTRDLLYVTDLAYSMMEVMKYPKAGYLEVHLGSGEEVSLTTMAETVITETHSESLIEYLGESVHPDVTNQMVDLKKEMFLPEAPVRLREGVQRTIAHIRDRRVSGGDSEL
jgi:UDP-glucose 4-epimerase